MNVLLVALLLTLSCGYGVTLQPSSTTTDELIGSVVSSESQSRHIKYNNVLTTINNVNSFEYSTTNRGDDIDINEDDNSLEYGIKLLSIFFGGIFFLCLPLSPLIFWIRSKKQRQNNNNDNNKQNKTSSGQRISNNDNSNDSNNANDNNGSDKVIENSNEVSDEIGSPIAAQNILGENSNDNQGYETNNDEGIVISLSDNSVTLTPITPQPQPVAVPVAVPVPVPVPVLDSLQGITIIPFNQENESD